MANSVLQDRYGPDWPLGFIKVAVPGTPVAISSLVDGSALNDPAAPLALPLVAPADIQSVAFQQIMFQGFKPGAVHGMVPNAGPVYIVRKPPANNPGSGNRDDPGVIVAVLTPGQTLFLASSASRNNVWGMYRYLIDADNANDGALVTGIVQ